MGVLAFRKYSWKPAAHPLWHVCAITLIYAIASHYEQSRRLTPIMMILMCRQDQVVAQHTPGEPRQSGNRHHFAAQWRRSPMSARCGKRVSCAVTLTGRRRSPARGCRLTTGRTRRPSVATVQTRRQALVPPQPQQEQPTMGAPPRRQRVTPDRRMSPRSAITVHGPIVPRLGAGSRATAVPTPCRDRERCVSSARRPGSAPQCTSYLLASASRVDSIPSAFFFCIPSNSMTIGSLAVE